MPFLKWKQCWVHLPKCGYDSERTVSETTGVLPGLLSSPLTEFDSSGSQPQHLLELWGQHSPWGSFITTVVRSEGVREEKAPRGSGWTSTESWFHSTLCRRKRLSTYLIKLIACLNWDKGPCFIIKELPGSPAPPAGQWMDLCLGDNEDI